MAGDRGFGGAPRGLEKKVARGGRHGGPIQGLLLASGLLLAGVAPPATAAPPACRASPTPGYRVLDRYPHDRDAFTQGLAFHQGALYESTGLYGRSTLRRIELGSGRVTDSRRLDGALFGEGLTRLGTRLVQLTWKAGVALLYRLDGLRPAGRFRFRGEGWGLTRLGDRLVLSDGSARLRFIDADGFGAAGTLRVTDAGRPVAGLNELETVDGLIYANVYPGDCIARIDPASGRVLGWLDLGGLLPLAERRSSASVANGIAWDAASRSLFVTGKHWPYIYRLDIDNDGFAGGDPPRLREPPGGGEDHA